MNKLFSLVAVVALFAAINAEARCGRRACAPRAACATQACPVSCEPKCSVEVLEPSVYCEPKPVCRTIVCNEPQKVCTKQEIIRCRWVCPPNCSTHESEEAANAANRGIANPADY